MKSKTQKAEIKDIFDSCRERREKHGILLKNIKNNMPKLELLLKEANDHWGCEDSIYRYYHGSFKVYYIQDLTERIFKALIDISPHEDPNAHLNADFMEIYKEGIGKIFDMSHNKEWSKNCRPMVEAFFHAKYFLEMAVKYGKELQEPPQCLPSGWAGLLYFYRIR